MDFETAIRYNRRMSLPPAEFVYDRLRIQGCSLAGEESFFVVPELNLAFDVGCSPREVIGVDHVFLSHGHMDHAAGLAYYFAQRMFVDNAPGNLYVAPELVAPAQKLLRAWADIDGHEPPANIHPVTPGEDVTVRRDLIVRPFTVNHPCRRHDRSVVEGLGFAAIEIRRKLKPEYEGLTGPQIVELKKKGVEVTRRIEIPLVTYCGDTGPGDFVDLEYVCRAKVLLLECTFVEADHFDRARAGGHMHVRDLVEIMPRLHNERIVLTHLSRRTLLSEARRILKRELGDLTDERVTFLMDARYRKRRSGPRRKPIANEQPSESK